MRKNILRSALFLALLATILTSALAVPASAAPSALPAPGALDPTFAGFTDDGIVVESGLMKAIGMALQPDGKIVVVGPTGTNNQLAVFRYLPNGNWIPASTAMAKLSSRTCSPLIMLRSEAMDGSWWAELGAGMMVSRWLA